MIFEFLLEEVFEDVEDSAREEPTIDCCDVHLDNDVYKLVILRSEVKTKNEAELNDEESL